MTRHLLHLAVIVLAMGVSACAARGGVPRPFPGAALPPGAAGRPEPEPRGPVPVPPGSLDAGVADNESSDMPKPRTPNTGAVVSDLDAVASAPGFSVSGIVATALSFRGTPYRNGGTDPSGFDCSGFVQYVFAKAGLLLPREVRDQSRAGKAIDREEVRPGDLVFFETVTKGPSHVGVALGGNEFVHAPSSRGVVRVERYTSTYWSERFIGARRLEGGGTETVDSGQ